MTNKEVFKNGRTQGKSRDISTKSVSVHHEEICHHLYNSGFINGLYHDVLLHVPSLTGDRAYKLHAIALCHSPLLADVLAKAADYKEITLEVDDSNITEQSFAISLGHLYAGYSHKILSYDNAKSVLASAYFLKLFDLCEMATKIICNNVRVETIKDISKFVQTTEGSTRPTEFDNSSTNSPALSSISLLSLGGTTKNDYGEYTELIKSRCLDFLCKELVEGVSLFGPNKDVEAYNRVSAVFVELSFEWLKTIFSSKDFKVASNDRYKFAQDIIRQRKHTPHSALGEESVVLAFGNSVSNVTLIRKAPRSSGKGNEGNMF